MVAAGELSDLIRARSEWLLIGPGSRSFAVTSSEIEIDSLGERVFIGFIDDEGHRSSRVIGYRTDDGQIIVETAGSFGRNRETLTLVPRELAADLAAEVELARLKKANEIAELIQSSIPGIKIGRVALNEPGGRLAQINFSLADKTAVAAVSDVTATMTVEAIFASAMFWIEKLGMRKKDPVSDIWIVAERRQARNAQKLYALLSDRWRAKITVVEIDRKKDPPVLTELPKRKIHDLWREKANKLVLPAALPPSRTADRIAALSRERIDTIQSKHGRTLRYNGVPFVRVRTVMGIEKVWFGLGRERTLLTNENWDDFQKFYAELGLNRFTGQPNRRHQLYRSAPEAWLESILRRDITLLDANLVLSPIYNQFRSATRKIDLLALRRDGRLVIIELKTQPDREVVFQAADYWRKIELQRRRGILAAANLFGDREIAERPAIVYVVAPAWSFHRDFEYFAKAVSPEIEIWRFDLHEDWRQEIRVVDRKSFSHEGDPNAS